MKKNNKFSIIIIFIIVMLISSCTVLNDDSSVNEPESENDNLLVEPSNEESEKSEVEESSEIEESSKIEINGKVFRKPEKNTSRNNSEKGNSQSDGNQKENSEKSGTNSESLKAEETSSEVSNPDIIKPNTSNKEVVGVWIAYLDYVGLLQNKSEVDARNSVESALKNLKTDGFNTIYLQIRPFSDAIYPSQIYPWSHILNSDLKQGVNPGYDPLKMIIDIANINGISVHGWINPYRIRLNNHPKTYANNNVLNNNNMSEKDYIILDNGSYINPASKNGQKIVLDGIIEVLNNYKLDGIQFDDYFYPSTNENIDSIYYNEYKNSGGNLDLHSWRRENVNTLVKNVYTEIKNIDKNIVFGVSPDSNISRNYTQHYADVEKWVKEKGYVDYLMPQIYFGFNHSTAAFLPTVKAWNDLLRNSDVELLVGLGPYKIGLEDGYAGDKGKNEWINNGNLLLQQYNESKKQETYKGVCLFRYDSIYNANENLKGQIDKEFNSFKEGLS